MPLRSLRTRLVALFLVSLAIAAFLFAAVAVRQFSQEERSRARSELSRQSLQIVQLIEEFAEKRLRGEAGAPADFATQPGWRSRRRTSTSSGARRPLAADRRGALRQGSEGHRGAARLEAARQEGPRADAQPEARRRHLDDRRRRPASATAAADRRDRRRPARALDQRLDARAGPPLRAAAAAGAGRGGARRAAAQPAHHAPGARADRGQRAHRARRLRRAPELQGP